MDEQLSAIIFLTLKIMSLVGLGVYVIIAAVMVRQEQLMAKAVAAAFEPALRVLVYIHLVASLGIFLLALILL